MTKYFAALMMFFIAWPSFAADPNGYTAQYECRAGGPHCNVDIATLTTAACATTITTADSNAQIRNKLDTGASPICVTSGDYTSKGEIYTARACTSGSRCVLRYTRSGDNNDEPWNQSEGNKAKFKQFTFDHGAAYWIVHRLTFDGEGATNIHPISYNSASNIIFNRILASNATNIFANHQSGTAPTLIWLQNSVVRNAVVAEESQVIEVNKTTFFRLVNSEIYNGNKTISVGDTSSTAVRGSVFENNDLYIAPDRYTNCSGTYTTAGPCTTSETVSSFKAGGTQTDPVLIIQNRIWGGRSGDGNLIGGNGMGGGGCMDLSGGFSGMPSWILLQNNICFDSEYGLVGYWGPKLNNSFVGNVIYSIRKRHTTGGFGTVGVALSAMQNTEFYLNTIIATDKWFDIGGLPAGALRPGDPAYPSSDNDIRCNVVIDGGNRFDGRGSGAQFDYNVYYGVNQNFGETNKINNALNNRANSTHYALNSIMRTSSTPTTSCVNGTESACFLYKNIQAGTTASSPPTPCTTLGCEYTDGAARWKAVRGPYIFKRKLRTVSGGESYAIPYARAHISAKELTCPTLLGSRPGIGINNDLLF